jgi:hypothetical protein
MNKKSVFIATAVSRKKMAGKTGFNVTNVTVAVSNFQRALR